MQTVKTLSQQKALSAHPFSTIQPDCEENLFGNYLAMSQAFPYLQSGSQKNVFDHYMDSDFGIPKEVEITSVVGNFLSWDETGGLYITLRKKMGGIADILNTKKNFHFNHLKNDMEKLFSKPMEPHYTPVTKKYLNALYKGLSHIDHVTRCAAMVSFESHANQMITSLWESVSKLHPEVTKESLQYFYEHVGGDDPAEAYHVKMTEDMVALIADTEAKQVQFANDFDRYYQLNVDWCKNITTLNPSAIGLAYNYAWSNWSWHDMSHCN